MKKLFKLAALSLSLIAAVFMLNTNAQTANGDVSLDITAITGHCVYGTSVYVGMTGFSYSAQTISTGFLSASGANRFCEDTEGDASWALSIQATSPLTNMDNTNYSIPASAVRVTNPQATVSPTSGCTADVLSNNQTPINSPTELFGKDSAIGEICTISIASLTLGVNIPAGQNVGTYSGTLQVSWDSTFGNGLMD